MHHSRTCTSDIVLVIIVFSSRRIAGVLRDVRPIAIEPHQKHKHFEDLLCPSVR